MTNSPHDHLSYLELKRFFAFALTPERIADAAWLAHFTARVRFCDPCCNLLRKFAPVFLSVAFERLDPRPDRESCIVPWEFDETDATAARHVRKCLACFLFVAELKALSLSDPASQVPPFHLSSAGISTDQNWERDAAGSDSPTVKAKRGAFEGATLDWIASKKVLVISNPRSLFPFRDFHAIHLKVKGRVLSPKVTRDRVSFDLSGIWEEAHSMEVELVFQPRTGRKRRGR